MTTETSGDGRDRPLHLGYSLSTEEHAPRDLVRYAQAAEDAGFVYASISDHFHPWIAQQGNSPFVWTVIGAIAAVTERLELGTGVTCPTIRYHPAIIAQAAATAASMMPGRFFLGVGTGEALNEHVVAERWPPFANIGGFLTTLLYGYPGIRVSAQEPRSWCERPVVMPGGWRGLHVERIYARGDEYALTAKAGAASAVIDGQQLRRVS